MEPDKIMSRACIQEEEFDDLEDNFVPEMPEDSSGTSEDHSEMPEETPEDPCETPENPFEADFCTEQTEQNEIIVIDDYGLNLLN